MIQDIFFFQEYCRGNTEDINNNIVEFKEAVQVRRGKLKCTSVLYSL